MFLEFYLTDHFLSKSRDIIITADTYSRYIHIDSCSSLEFVIRNNPSRIIRNKDFRSTFSNHNRNIPLNTSSISKSNKRFCRINPSRDSVSRTWDSTSKHTCNLLQPIPCRFQISDQFINNRNHVFWNRNRPIYKRKFCLICSIFNITVELFHCVERIHHFMERLDEVVFQISSESSVICFTFSNFCIQFNDSCCVFFLRNQSVVVIISELLNFSSVFFNFFFVCFKIWIKNFQSSNDSCNKSNPSSRSR